MPIRIKPGDDESRSDWMSRCLSNDEVQAAADSDRQAQAICFRRWRNPDKSVDKEMHSRLGHSLREAIDAHIADRAFLAKLLARAAGVSRSTVRDYLSTERLTCPSREQLANMAAVLDVAPRVLMNAARADGCTPRFSINLSRSTEGGTMEILDKLKFWDDSEDDETAIVDKSKEELHTYLAALNQQYTTLGDAHATVKERAEEVAEELVNKGGEIPAGFDVVEADAGDDSDPEPAGDSDDSDPTDKGGDGPEEPEESPLDKHDQYTPISGPDNAPVLFVGAAPSVVDTVRTKALAGPDGRVFEDAYLSEVDLSRNDVQVGNLIPVVVRNEEDRVVYDPDDDVLAKWEDWFWEAVEEKNPQHIVALGTTARDWLGERADGWLAHPSAVRKHGDDGRVGRKLNNMRDELLDPDHEGEWRVHHESEKAKVELAKADDDQQIGYFVVYEPFEKDAHGEWARPEEIEKAAHEYLRNYGVVGKNHAKPIAGEVVENWTAKTTFTLGNERVAKGSWVVGIHVADDAEWARLKNDEYGGISMGGRARRR